VGRSQQTVIAAVDAARVDDLALEARAGTHVDPPVEPTDDPMEIGRRIIAALDSEHDDQDTDDESRNAAYSDIRALSVSGAAARAQVTTISGAFSVPSYLVTNGNGAVASSDDPNATSNDADMKRRTQYIQPDFATWELIQWVRDHLANRRDGLGVTVAMFDEILKLKDMDGYAGLSPRDAMLKAGLDPKTMEIDLDQALAALETDDDVGIQETTG
jgi:hypothetical protein